MEPALSSRIDSKRNSTYPDGTERDFTIVERPRTSFLISERQIRRILCHRLDSSKLEEQYLVEWRVSPFRSYSWHNVDELLRCLSEVQKYLAQLSDDRKRSPATFLTPTTEPHSKKRKSLDGRDQSPASSNTSKSSTFVPKDANAFYGKVIRAGGRITVEADESLTRHDYMSIPTARMRDRAMDPKTSTRRAEFEIAKLFRKRLSKIPSPAGGHAPVTLCPNTSGAPSLDFEFIDNCVLGRNVKAPPDDFVFGCGSYTEPGVHAGSCRPNMGQEIGCEYSRICECLELAPVDKARLTAEQRDREEAGEMMGLPKKFPYYGLNTRSPNCLISFYLDRRNEIYECNPKCACGPKCKTRVVQHGRQVPLQIFHTENRGWGLRCPWPLKRGQFIDTYRGEIITDAEAKKREDKAEGKSKNSYLFLLDKFKEEDQLLEDEILVVDGEFMGGPSRFMNHSCDPNCCQYVVSLNKYDRKIYELAFFATEDIEAGQELTFDYLDAEQVADSQYQEETEAVNEDAVPCYCGSDQCRGYLWR